MELPELRQTMFEIEQRTPLALQIAFGVRFGSRPASDAALYGIDVDALLKQCARWRRDLMELDEAPRALRMDTSSCYLKDHDEDDHFCNAEAGVVGVADGVGGYRLKGVDAAAFSRGLMRRAAADVAFAVPGTKICPYTLLEMAYEQTVASRTQGASTAVILSLAGRTLKWAYVGDSGFAVFRDGKIMHRSKPQQVYFNCPLQLSAAPRSSKAISNAAVGEMQVKEDDVVVVASDGLFDNLFDKDLERVVQIGTALSFTPKNMADIMAAHAYDLARKIGRDSPFSAASREQEGTEFKCGKIDDITVVVAFIVS